MSIEERTFDPATDGPALPELQEDAYAEGAVDLEGDVPADGPAAQDGGASLLQRAAAARDERYAKGEHVTLPVPTWRDDRDRPTLYARYRVLKEEEIEGQMRDGMNTGAAAANADFLIKACIGVLAPGDDGQLVRIEKHGRPVRFDGDLAEMLSIETDRARDVVYYLFTPRDEENPNAWRTTPNTVAVVRLAVKVWDWMEDTSRQLDEALLGE